MSPSVPTSRGLLQVEGVRPGSTGGGNQRSGRKRRSSHEAQLFLGAQLHCSLS